MSIEEKERLVSELEQKLEAAHPFSMLTNEHMMKGGMRQFYKDYYILQVGKDKVIETVDLHRKEFLPLLDYVIKYCPDGYRRGYKK